MYADCQICEYLQLIHDSYPKSNVDMWFWCEYAEAYLFLDIEERGSYPFCAYPRKAQFLTLAHCLAKSEKRYEYLR